MNNKGLTLIEVLVSIAIMSIVTVCVTGFINIGTKTSSKSQIESSLQREAQTTVNQKTDWVMEATRGIVVYGSHGLEESEIEDPTDLENTLYDMAVAIYSDTDTDELDVQIIFYHKAKRKLYYHKQTIAAGLRETGIQSIAATLQANGWEKNLFAQYVEEFKIEQSTYNEQVFNVDIEFKLQQYSFDVSNRIKMRNTPVSDPAAY